MTNTDIYYVYAYIRSKDSKTAKAGTPYYIGKGKDVRAWGDHKYLSVPKEHNLIVILETNLTELGAFAIERRLILWWGRKDIGSGILLNLTDGGEGTSGYKYTEEQLARMSIQRTGRILSEETKLKMSVAALGKPKTKEHAKNISLGQMGRIISEEQRMNHSKKMLGRKHTVEHKESIKQGMINSDIVKARTHLAEAGVRIGKWANDHREELMVKIKHGWSSQTEDRKKEIALAAAEKTRIQLQNESIETKIKRAAANSQTHTGNKWYTNGTSNKRTKYPETLSKEWVPGITVHK